MIRQCEADEAGRKGEREREREKWKTRMPGFK